MASILNKVNNMIEKNLGEDYASERKFDLVLNKYKEMHENGKVFKVAFDMVNPDGTFEMMDKDVTVVLPAEQFLKYAESGDTHATALLLGIDFQVSVYQVDAKKRKVYVELAGASKASYSANIRAEIGKEIEKSLNAGKYPVVWGRVTKVTRDNLLVDILDKGVLGFLNKKDWGKDYVRNLEAVCKEGDFFQFEVIGRAQKEAGKTTAWLLSRKKLSVSIWDNLNTDDLCIGGVILVKCIEKPHGKSFWWGHSDRLPGIDIMGDFSSKFPNANNLYTGITYKCKIEKLDVTARKITVVPFEIIASDIQKVENIKFARGRKLKKDYM